MKNEYEFFIAGRARNKENILKICDLFDKYKVLLMDQEKNVMQQVNMKRQILYIIFLIKFLKMKWNQKNF